MRSRSQRGGALGLVLAVAALALLAAFTAANVATLNLRVSSTTSNAAIAESLAESVVQTAMANLQEDLGSDDPVSIDGKSVGLPDGSRGYLTFDNRAGTPYSTNNFLGEKPDGWQRDLPEATAHLVGVGECGGVRKHVEVVLHLPEFPVVMGCDGPVTVRNSFIGGFNPEDEREWVPGEGYIMDEDEIGPGHLVTNNDSSTSVVLDNRSKVTGDIQSAGTVQLNGAIVEGEVRAPWGKKAPLPDFKLADFDPASDEDFYYEDIPSSATSLTLTGNVRRDGDMVVTNDLTLDDAFLYVRGNLVVNGNLRGQGSIVALGKVTFEGTVDFESGDQLAVLSGGGIDVVGRDPTRSVFQGLLYTQGNFLAEKITIVGGFVVANGGATRVVDSTVFFSGVNIAPTMKRQTAAVIPRFTIPDPTAPGNVKDFDEQGLPYVRWNERGVHSVVFPGTPGFARSDWKYTDPAVIVVYWVGDETRIRYYWYGTGGLAAMPSMDGYWTDAREAAQRIAFINTGGDQSHTATDILINEQGGSLPDRTQYENFVFDTIGHLETMRNTAVGYNFSLDPNEFVGDDEEIRVLLHRVF